MSTEEEKPEADKEQFNFTTEDFAKHEGKSSSKHYDPCAEFSKRSIKCIYRNPGQKDLCNDYFQAYRDCKKAWGEHLKEERRKRGGGFFS